MRGKGKMAVQVNRETRITPAYAGKSTGNCFAIHIKWDHPRLCGEKYRTANYFQTDKGITPAYAGKS